MPRAAQNSDSPYHFTARMFRKLEGILYYFSVMFWDCFKDTSLLRGKGIEYAPIANDDNPNDSASRDSVAPVVNDEVTGDDFEGNKGSFKDEEIPTCSHTKGLVDVAASKTYKRRRDW